MQVLIVDDDFHIRQALKRALTNQELNIIERRSIHEPKPTNFTPEREHGWYRQFDKNNKRKNFARK